jgi:hypothetical protein
VALFCWKTRTVRFDKEAEQVLSEIRAATGLPISAVLKRGLRALQENLRLHAPRTLFDIYREIDLDPGGHANYSSANSREGVRAALKRKHGR